MKPDALFAALEATWPAARTIALPRFTIREGRGGGKRVSAAIATGPVDMADIDAAEQAMLALGQPRLFALRDKGEPLDTTLAQRGYRICDETVIRACPIESLLGPPPPPLSAFTIWEPLQIMRDIWAEGGIGPDRVAVMERVGVTKTGVFGRSSDKPVGTGFVAISDGVAMVHALEVRADFRRLGTARQMMQAAVHWAAAQGAQQVALAVTEANEGANILYSSLGMPICAKYHYRIKD